MQYGEASCSLAIRRNSQLTSDIESFPRISSTKMCLDITGYDVDTTGTLLSFQCFILLVHSRHATVLRSNLLDDSVSYTIVCRPAAAFVQGSAFVQRSKAVKFSPKGRNKIGQLSNESNSKPKSPKSSSSSPGRSLSKFNSSNTLLMALS